MTAEDEKKLKEWFDAVYSQISVLSRELLDLRGEVKKCQESAKPTPNAEQPKPAPAPKVEKPTEEPKKE